ncbi:hypothetical protein CCACVL1_03838 [Corchorus capsularis]|uniref:Uncharacterized protein n=1 Tax=Corchorus capsularis TaxID=210143 RepID=A0A1R3JWY3_COCAP|nr:hypothetical protein CCACVL1_03838 [Corchorus capsularis]
MKLETHKASRKRKRKHSSSRGKRRSVGRKFNQP